MNQQDRINLVLMPSRAALAARSLARVDRLTDREERRAAFRAHVEAFPPLFTQV